MNSKQKQDLYYIILDHISDINNKLLEINSDSLYNNFTSTHRLLYDKIYTFECLIFAEIKNLEQEKQKEILLKKEKSLNEKDPYQV